MLLAVIETPLYLEGKHPTHQTDHIILSVCSLVVVDLPTILFLSESLTHSL